MDKTQPDPRSESPGKSDPNSGPGKVLPSSNVAWESGRVIAGRYAVEKELGSGGMAQVFLADDLFLRKKVAVKALRPIVACEPGHLDRFRREVALAHTVTHPNAVRIFDLGEDDGIYFISMEHLEGQTLRDRLARDGALPVDEVRQIGMLTCRALEAAHRAHVIHRDLKPNNIMLVNDERRVVVMDFGISGLDEEEVDPDQAEAFRNQKEGEKRGWTVTSSGMGTLKYMSPEQVQQLPCGPPSDIYTLGAILFRCLTGRHIFEREQGSYAFAHITREAPGLRSIDPNLPVSLDRIVERCLRKEPTERFRSAAELGRALNPPRASFLVIALLLVALIGATLSGLTIGLTSVAERTIIREMRPAVQRLAELTRSGIDVEVLDTIHLREDIETPRYRSIQEKLVAAQSADPEVDSIYILRKLAPRSEAEQDFLWEIVVDSDPYPRDKNGDGDQTDEGEQGAPPGTVYDTYIPAMIACLSQGKPTSDEEFMLDPWGYTLSGYAPIGEVRSVGGYILGVDVKHDRLLHFRRIVAGACLAAWLLLSVLVVLVARRMRISAARSRTA